MYNGGSFIIGQEQDGKPDAGAFDPLFDKLQGFTGQVTQVEIWNTILTLSEIEIVANCTKSTIKSAYRVVSWESDTWSSHGTTTFKEVPLKNLCKRNIIRNQFIWPRSIDNEQLTSYCDTMGAIPPILNQNDEWKNVYDYTLEVFKSVNDSFPSSFVDKNKRNGIQCFSDKGDISFWTGLTRNATTGIWNTKYNPAWDFSNFEFPVPSEAMNCVYYKFGQPSPSPCDSMTACGTCKISLNTVFYLKGLCASDQQNYDTKYYFHGVKNNRPYLK